MYKEDSIRSLKILSELENPIQIIKIQKQALFLILKQKKYIDSSSIEIDREQSLIMSDFSCKPMLKWLDHWKCQCLMITRLALWLDSHKLFQKALQISATTVSFLTLTLSILSLSGKEEIQMYFPVYGHFLLNSESISQLESFEDLAERCHSFQSLKHVKFVGFNNFTFYQIRIVILFILFVTDMLGLFFSFAHSPCGTKMYVFGLTVTLLFFVLFPSELCINFGDICIEYSPIFYIYRLQFMIQFNVAWLGLASILLIIIVITVAHLVRQNCNYCGVSIVFFQIIYGIVFIPFIGIALINFITSLWTSSALINILTLTSMIINYLLYHAGTDIHEQIIKNQKEIESLIEPPPKDLFQGQYESIYFQNNEYQNLQGGFESIDLNKSKDKILEYPKKSDRMRFYQQWQDRLYRQFNQP